MDDVKCENCGRPTGDDQTVCIICRAAGAEEHAHTVRVARELAAQAVDGRADPDWVAGMLGCGAWEDRVHATVAEMERLAYRLRESGE